MILLLPFVSYVEHQAWNYGQRVMMTLVNYWEGFGGMDVYVSWSSTAFQREDFYTDPYAKSLFKDHISVMLNHVNAFTGLVINFHKKFTYIHSSSESSVPLDLLYSSCDAIKSHHSPIHKGDSCFTSAYWSIVTFMVVVFNLLQSSKPFNFFFHY